MAEAFGPTSVDAGSSGLSDPDSSDECPPDDVEQCLENLQIERCACMVQLKTLLADYSASSAQIERYLHRIEAINGIMLSLARATAADGIGPDELA